MALVHSLVGTVQKPAAGAGSTGFTTASSFNPTAGALLTAFVAFRGDSGVWAGTPTLSGVAGSWTIEDSILHSHFSNSHGIYVFRSTDGTPTNEQITFARGGSDTYSIAMFALVETTGATVTGTDAEDAFVANTKKTATSTTSDPAVLTYDNAFGSASNGVLAAYMLISANVRATPKTGQDELADDGVDGQMSLTIHSKTTSDTTAEADYTGTNANVKVAIAFEIAVAAAASATRPAGINRGLINNGLINGGLIR